MSEQTAKTNALLRKKKVLSPEPEPSGGAVAPSFEVVPIVEKLDLWWQGGKYYFRRAGADGFSELNQAEITRFLKVDFGLGNRPMERPDDPAAARIPGQIDRVLNYVVTHRYIDVVASVAGMKAGFTEQNGFRLLNMTSPTLIEPQAGDCSTILEFIETLLGEAGSLRFLLWLKVGFEALRDSQRRPGQCLVLCGKSGKGKSVLQDVIITGVLGGREADPKSYLLGKTDFNSELISAEHLKVEEIPSSVRYDERVTLGERIKEMCVNHTDRLHAKNRPAQTVKPQRRLSLSLNDEPERLRSLPPLTTDFRDKLLLLKTTDENFFSRYDGIEGGFEVFRDAVKQEMPAFSAHLLAMVVPEHLRDRRYGVRSFVDPEIEEMLFDQEGESILLSIIDEVAFGSSSNLCFDNETGTFTPWEASSTEVVEKLTDQGVKGYTTARKLFEGSADKCGQLLGKLAKKFPNRFEKGRSGARRFWIIKPPAGGES